jgi:hypothetical protein
MVQKVQLETLDPKEILEHSVLSVLLAQPVHKVLKEMTEIQEQLVPKELVVPLETLVQLV